MTEKEQEAEKGQPGSEPQKLDLRSHDIAADKREQLLRLFPEVRTEDGKLDFDRLKLALAETVDVGKERYGLTWPGKADCFKAIQTPSLGTLRPCPEESVDFDSTENLIIEGDNLEVLKLLQKSYLGEVKVIYIDPPYNTGNDLIYPDDFSESLQTYLEYTGQVGAEGRRFGTNTETDGRFHSKWLSMMYPRLYLARNLLRDDGAVFISIDDVELANLTSLANEVFGADHFVGCIVWEKTYTPKSNGRVLSTDHDYILVYCKSERFIESGWNLLSRTAEQEGRFSNPDNDPKGPWRTYPLDVRTEDPAKREKYRYEVETPSGRKVRPSAGRHWALPKEKFMEELSAGNVYFGKKGDAMPTRKVYLSEAREGVLARTWWPYKEVGGNQDAKQELLELFDDEPAFLTPKPTSMIRRILELSSTPDCIVLDFFAGSGTTGQAVLELNKADGGNRRFLLVQLPEPYGEGQLSTSSTLRTIADLTRMRIRRASERLNEAAAGELDLDLTSGQDRGFRSFKLAESNFATWDAEKPQDAETLGQQLEIHVDHIREGRSEQDLLYEILLKSGFPLTTSIEALAQEGKTVYSVAGGDMLVCLDRALTLEVIRAMAARQPARVVCLDAGFAGNDQLKTNAVQTFKTKGVTSFKTI